MKSVRSVCKESVKESLRVKERERVKSVKLCSW